MSQPSLGSMLSTQEKATLTQALLLLLAMLDHVPAGQRPRVDDVEDLLDRVNEPAQDPSPRPGGEAHVHRSAEGSSSSVNSTVTGTLIQAGRIHGGVNVNRV